MRRRLYEHVSLHQGGLPMTALRRLGLLAPLAALSLAGCGLNSVPTAEENVNAKWGDVQSRVSAPRRPHPEPGRDGEGLCQAGKQRPDRRHPGPGRRRPGPAQRQRPRRSGQGPGLQRCAEPPDPGDHSAAAAAGGLSGPQVEPELPDAAEPDRGHRESILRRARDYNEAVQAYNTRIRTFPDAIGAKIFYGAKPKVPFEAAAGAQDAPRVDFNTTPAEVKRCHRRSCWLACFRAGRARRGADFPPLTGRVVDQAHLLTPAQVARPHEQVGGARGADRAPVRRRDGHQPRRATDRGLRLPARPRLGDRRQKGRRRRHPAGRAQRAEGADRDRLWRGGS